MIGRLTNAVLLLTGLLLLGGCVAGMATSAIGMAVQGARGRPQSNEQLRPVALTACTARAVQYGTVHVIDVEQASPSRIIVWGTVADAAQKRSFECRFGKAITRFTLRPIASN